MRRSNLREDSEKSLAKKYLNTGLSIPAGEAFRPLNPFLCNSRYTKHYIIYYFLSTITLYTNKDGKSEDNPAIIKIP